MTPAEVDDAMETWLPASITSSISIDWQWRAGEPHVSGYRCEHGFAEQDAGAAVKILEMLNARASRPDCAKEIGRLKLLTKERPQDDRDMILQIAAMAEELSAYPLDVVRSACRAWTERGTFFPSWAELRELCEEGVLKRRCLLNALRRYFGQKADHVDDDEETELPYNALWNMQRKALEQAIGIKEFAAWLSTLTPIDPGSEATFYQLGAPTRFIRDWVDREYRERIEDVLKRPVRIIHYSFSIEGTKRRARGTEDAA